jgi:hypothetical protein
MATKKPIESTIKAVIKTPRIRVELQGAFPGALGEMLYSVPDRADREKLLKQMHAVHERLCKSEDERAAAAPGEKAHG